MPDCLPKSDTFQFSRFLHHTLGSETIRKAYLIKKHCPTGQCFSLFPELLTVLGAQPIRALRTLQCKIGFIPKPLRIHHHTQFPYQPGCKSREHQAHAIKAPHEDQRREHHQMVPVENPAGGAAPGFHHQPKGAPDQHTDQIAHIKGNRDQKQQWLVQHTSVIEYAEHCQQTAPEQKDLIGRLGGGDNVFPESLLIDFLPNGPEAAGKKAS